MTVATSLVRWPHWCMDTTSRSAVIAASVALGLLAVGCNTTAGSPSAGTEPHQRGQSQGRTAQQLDKEKLELALLDLNDLPEGWASDTEGAAKERGIGVPQPKDQPCRALFDQRARGQVENRFARTEVGPFVITRAASHESGEHADKTVEGYRKAAKECEGFAVAEGPEGDTTEVNYQADELDMPQLGDESIAVRFVREGPGDEEMTVLADVVYVRVGGNSVHLAQAGIDDEGAGDVEPLVRRAVDKLTEVASDKTPEPTGSFPDVTQLRADPYAPSHE